MSIWAITEHNYKDVTVSLVVYFCLCVGGVVKVKPEFTYKHANKHTNVLMKNTKRSTFEG